MLIRGVPSCATRLSWHGFAVNEALASVMQTPPLDVAALAKPHELAGSGWFLPCATAVLFSFLASVELKDDYPSIPRPLHDNTACLVETLQNGRCFVACLFLQMVASPQERRIWANQARNLTNAPLVLSSGQVDLGRLRYEESRSLSLTIYTYIYIYKLYIHTHTLFPKQTAGWGSLDLLQGFKLYFAVLRSVTLT